MFLWWMSQEELVGPPGQQAAHADLSSENIKFMMKVYLDLPSLLCPGFGRLEWQKTCSNHSKRPAPALAQGSMTEHLSCLP